MNTIQLRMKLCAALALMLLGGFGARAQMPGSSGPAGMSAAMTKLFGDVTAFTAKAELKAFDAEGSELMSTPMDFALLDKNFRVAIDMTKMNSVDMPPGAAAQLKRMGMSQVVSIVRTDKKLVYVSYPEQQALLSMPLPPEEVAAAAKAPRLEKTALGKETMDGHPCVKNKVVIKDDKGQTLEATTWEATDLKNFPIQIQTKEKKKTSVVHFRNIQFVKPDAKEFDPPTGYTQYDSPQQMMQAIMKKMGR